MPLRLLSHNIRAKSPWESRSYQVKLEMLWSEALSVDKQMAKAEHRELNLS